VRFFRLPDCHELFGRDSLCAWVCWSAPDADTRAVVVIADGEHHDGVCSDAHDGCATAVEEGFVAAFNAYVWL